MFNRKGQNVAEYAILLALVVAAAVTMQTYVKRGLQGRMADATDHRPDTDMIAGKPIVFKASQYEPYYVDNQGYVNSNRDATDNLGSRGQTARTLIGEKTTKQAGAHEFSIWVGENAR